MADSTNQIYVHSLDEANRMTPNRIFSVPNTVIDMLCCGNYVFVALSNGCVLKYAKRKGRLIFLLDLISVVDHPVVDILDLES